MTRRAQATAWIAATCALAALAVAMRVNNAFAFPVKWGFDAVGNWDYIDALTRSWALPAPDSGWSTSHPPFFYYLSASFIKTLGHPRIPLDLDGPVENKFQVLDTVAGDVEPSYRP